MPLKNATGGAARLLPSGDGVRWPGYPAGDKPVSLALLFPKNTSASNQTDPYAVMRFAQPQLNGLPCWGAGGAGITMVRRIQTHSPMQVGYMAPMWWSRDDGTFVPSDGYWGMHGYPVRGYNIPNNYSGVGHFIHEVAVAGWDIIDAAGTNWAGQNSSFDGTNWGVVTGQRVLTGTVYLQGLRITRTNANSKTLRAYNNLPNVDDANCCQAVVTNGNTGISNYGETPVGGVNYAFTLGDSPWYPANQHERGGCAIAAFKIFNALLSETDMLAEAADFSAIKTSAGAAAIWYGRNGFTSAHIVDGASVPCSYGTGRSFTTLNPSNNPIHQLSLIAGF